jgi:dipeptidyl aminopeptidase/acylaminoacyl peptidase
MAFFNARAVVAALSMLAPVTSFATDTLIPVEDFARHVEVMDPSLSPDGRYLAVRMDDKEGGIHSLVIYRVDDMSMASVLHMPKRQLPLGITWVSPTRLVVETGKVLGSLDKPVSEGEIIATDVDGKKQDYLYGYDVTSSTRAGTRATDQGWGAIDGKPENANGHFYMAAQPWDNDHISQLYDVDAVHNTRHLIGDIDVTNMNFMVGADGQAHYAYGTNADFERVIYQGHGSSWSKQSNHEILYPITYTPDHAGVYASWSPDGGPLQLIKRTEDGGNQTVLAKDGFSNADEPMWTPTPRQPFAVLTSTGIPTPIYIDKDLPASKLHDALSKKFPGEVVTFIKYSEDGSRLLFGVASDRDPGSYYLLDTVKYKATKLFSVLPWIKPERMAERRPFRFKASDGMELEGYITMPPGAGEANLPMVLLPHGGPFNERDDWFYDNDAQFLASRGYLVLQVNFRGSSGRGDRFVTDGYKKWGTRIQQDLIDGTRWAIAQNYADPKRVCVYGSSFGGYSALMTVIRQPDMFKCAIGYAGVYDLAMMYDKGDTRMSKWGRSFLANTVGTDRAEMQANSPAYLAEQITVPVFLIHGENDERAPFAHAKAMRAALEKAHKPYEWLSKSGEGHGFYDEANNVELLTKLQAFLEKNIGKGADTTH